MTTKETRRGAEGEPLSSTTLSDTREKTRAPPLRSLAVHADGTRVCRDAPAGCLWRVEKEGFATTHADAVTKDIAVDLGSGRVSVDADGVSCVALGANGSFGAICADVSGLVAFVPGNAEVFETEREVDEAASRLLSRLWPARGARSRAAATPRARGRGARRRRGGRRRPDVRTARSSSTSGAALCVSWTKPRDASNWVSCPSKDAPESERENLSASDALGPSASVGTLTVGDDTEPLGDASSSPRPPRSSRAPRVSRRVRVRRARPRRRRLPPAKTSPAAAAGGGSDARSGFRDGKGFFRDGKDGRRRARWRSDAPAPPRSETVAAEPLLRDDGDARDDRGGGSRVGSRTGGRRAARPAARVRGVPGPGRVLRGALVRRLRALPRQRASPTPPAPPPPRPCRPPEAAWRGRGEPHVPHAATPGARAARADARARAVAEAARRRGGRAASRAQPSRRPRRRSPAAPATLVVPRIAATDEMFGTKDRHRRDSTDVSSRSDKTFVFRQIIEYPAMSDAAVAALDRAVHAEADASLEHARVAPESHLLRDVRSDAFLVAEQNLADRVVAARRSKEAAYAARRAEELAAEAEEARRLAEEALDSGIYALAREAKVAPRADPRRRGDRNRRSRRFRSSTSKKAAKHCARSPDGDGFVRDARTRRGRNRSRRNPALLGPADVTAAETRRRFAFRSSVRLAAPEPPPPRVFVGRRRDARIVRGRRPRTARERRPPRLRFGRSPTTRD